MVSNKEFLQWIHDRMIHVHGEPENMDYMHRFGGIIDVCDGTDFDEMRDEINELNKRVGELKTRLFNSGGDYR